MSADKGKVSGKMAECPCEGSTLDKLVQPAILTILSDGPLHGYGPGGTSQPDANVQA